MSYEGDLATHYNGIRKKLIGSPPIAQKVPTLVEVPPPDKTAPEAFLIRMRLLEERMAMLEFKTGIATKTYPHYSHKLSLDDIFQLVRIKENYQTELLLGGQHAKDLALVRQIIYYLQSTKTTKSYPEIGRYMKKDHSTILHGAKKIAKLRHHDANLNSRLCWYENEIDRLTAIKNHL